MGMVQWRETISASASLLSGAVKRAWVANLEMLNVTVQGARLKNGLDENFQVTRSSIISDVLKMAGVMMIQIFVPVVCLVTLLMVGAWATLVKKV